MTLIKSHIYAKGDINADNLPATNGGTYEALYLDTNGKFHRGDYLKNEAYYYDLFSQPSKNFPGDVFTGVANFNLHQHKVGVDENDQMKTGAFAVDFDILLEGTKLYDFTTKEMWISHRMQICFMAYVLERYDTHYSDPIVRLSGIYVHRHNQNITTEQANELVFPVSISGNNLVIENHTQAKLSEQVGVYAKYTFNVIHFRTWQYSK